MLLTNHVLSGALIGAVARRPATAFTAGVVSHFVLDAAPHWGDWRSHRQFLRVATADGLASLAVAAAITAAAPPDRRLAVLAGLTGAALPDADKPTREWFGWSPWPRAVNQFHGRIQHEAFHRAPFEFLAAAALAAVTLIVLRSHQGGGRQAGVSSG